VASKDFTEGRHQHLVAEVDLFGPLKLVQCAMSSAWSTRTEAGCGMSDLAELVSYHVGLSTHLAEFAKVKGRRFRPGRSSTSRALRARV
jgi:hypothetical protein